MHKLIAGTFCMFLSTAASAQFQNSGNQSPIILASGAVYFAHCDKRCDELRCPDKKACYKSCVDNKGTVSMCFKTEGKGK
ncbi:MAG: hypothetical protein JWN94_2703 [Betaproteobacteria bacterium]|nr:hypothetical protein [Betaproteobacteria bacterium]